MGNGEWGMGREGREGRIFLYSLLPTLNSELRTPNSLLPTPYSPLPLPQATPTGVLTSEGRRSITWSIKPYSFASSADIKKSLSVSS